MRKLTNFILTFFFACSLFSAQSEIKLTTSHELGSNITLFPKPAGNAKKVIIDWGDGVQKEHTLSMWVKSVSSDKVGDTIRIITPLVSFDCSETKVTSLSIINEPELTQLDCYSNEIEYTGLDVSGALNLQSLSCQNNPLLLYLNLMEHTKLVSLDCRYDKKNPTDTEERGGITTLLLPLSDSKLESITAYNNDISSINLTGCQELRDVNLEGNSLMDIDVTKCLKLKHLDVRSNIISNINVTKNLLLEKLYCGNNVLTELNVFANTELLDLACSNNKLTTLDLSQNNNITNLSFDGNMLTKIDVSNMSRLKSLKCSNNNLEYIDLSKNPYIQKFWGQNNKFSFFDFYYNTGLNTIDIRNNTRMTPSSLNYMYQSLPALESTSSFANLLLQGCNVETSNTDIAIELKWLPDLKGDGSAISPDVKATITASEFGSITLYQPDLSTHELLPIVENTIKGGIPVSIKSTPLNNYKTLCYRVNGIQIMGNTFFTENDVTVSAEYVPETSGNYILLDVESNTFLSLGISGIMEETEVQIDWGNGEFITSTVNNVSISRLEGYSKGNTIRINGLLDYFDCSENDLLGLDVSNNTTLKTLDCYWTNITALDVTKNINLSKLNCSFNSIKTLDLTNNKDLFSLSCYNCDLSEIDLTKNTMLQEVTLKNNNFTELNLLNNNKISYLDIQNNQNMKSIEISQLTELDNLKCANIGATEFDLTKNTNLVKLTCSNNKLTTIDLSKNALLKELYCDGNQITALDLSKNTQLEYLDCSNNGMTACTLNDIYYKLAECPITPTKVNLYIYGEINPNQGEVSETSIATRKGWIVPIAGDGTGCNDAYITVLPVKNGNIELRDSNNEIVKSGNKVLKNSIVKIIATPNEGYRLENVSVNGVNIVTGEFTVKMASTVAAIFAQGAAVNEIESNETKVFGANGYINIQADNAEAKVYTISGNLVWQGSVNGSKNIEISSGMYIVELNNYKFTRRMKIIVK